MLTHLQPVKSDYEGVLGKKLSEAFDIDEQLTPSIENLVKGWLTINIGAVNVMRLLAIQTGAVISPTDQLFIELGKSFLAAAALSRWVRFGNIQFTRSGAVQSESKAATISAEDKADMIRALDATAKGFATQLSALSKSLIVDTCCTRPTVGNGSPSVSIISAPAQSLFNREL